MFVFCKTQSLPLKSGTEQKGGEWYILIYVEYDWEMYNSRSKDHKNQSMETWVSSSSCRKLQYPTIIHHFHQFCNVKNRSSGQKSQTFPLCLRTCSLTLWYTSHISFHCRMWHDTAYKSIRTWLDCHCLVLHISWKFCSHFGSSSLLNGLRT
jgi:hypothetical protein